MNNADEIEKLKEKHADVLNPAVDNIVNWEEPILGDGAPPPTEKQFIKTFKTNLKFLTQAK